jgi:hypothetical protein
MEQQDLNPEFVKSKDFASKSTQVPIAEADAKEQGLCMTMKGTWPQSCHHVYDGCQNRSFVYNYLEE